MKIYVKDILRVLGNNVQNIHGYNEELYITNIKPAKLVNKYSLDWIANNKINKQIIAEESKSLIILCEKSIVYSDEIKKRGKVLINVKNPKLALSIIANHFFINKPSPGIHSLSDIHPKAKIHSTVYIGPNCTIGNCIIGENTIIYPNVVIYDNTIIGKNVVIQSGSVIGTDGLGCERNEDGSLVKFVHMGGVEIKDDVEIGANSQIAKGALTNTIIGRGCKINGLSFIAHNCILGENILITGNTMLAGSVKVKNNSTIYSKVIIREQRIIGENAIIGMGSVVTKDVPDNETWIGCPAKRLIK